MKADPTKLFDAARRNCQLGIKAAQNVASSLEAFRRLLEVRSRPEPDRVLMSALFHMAVIRYAKPFTATKTPEGTKTSYPEARVNGAERFNARIHKHLLKVRNTLVAHDDFSEIEPRLLGLGLTPSGSSASKPLTVSIANCCLEYPTVGIEAMTRHVAALGHALVQNLADDLARLMQVAGEHAAVAAAASRRPPRTLGTFTVPPMGTAGLAFDPASDPYMDVPRPTFEDLGIVYEYAKCIATKGQETAIELNRGVFARVAVGLPGSGLSHVGDRSTPAQEETEEPGMSEQSDWRRVLFSVTTQAEFAVELVPPYVHSAVSATRQRFEGQVAEFKKEPSLDRAIAIDELGRSLLRRAQVTSSPPEREALAGLVLAGFELVRAEAQKRAGRVD